MNTEITDNNGMALFRPEPRVSVAVMDWLPPGVVVGTALAERDRLPAWVFMWSLAVAVFLGCKWLTWNRAVRGGSLPGLGRVLGYLVAWPGMDPLPFLRKSAASKSIKCGGDNADGPATWLTASAKVLCGVVLFVLAARGVPGLGPFARGWMAMAGIVLFLHFGIFHLLALAWRHAGVAVKPLMRAPLCATSLSDFWSRRWNTAFNRLAHDLVFRPLARRVGAAGATMAAFVASGLIHDAVISVPARGGYGLPTAYFVIQGLGVLLERTTWGRCLGLGPGFRGRLFALAFAAGPAFWLFHPPFIRNVILPMLDAFGAK